MIALGNLWLLLMLNRSIRSQTSQRRRVGLLHWLASWLCWLTKRQSIDFNFDQILDKPSIIHRLD